MKRQSAIYIQNSKVSQISKGQSSLSSLRLLLLHLLSQLFEPGYTLLLGFTLHLPCYPVPALSRTLGKLCESNFKAALLFLTPNRVLAFPTCCFPKFSPFSLFLGFLLGDHTSSL